MTAANSVNDLIARWMVAREELAALEQAEHPDVTDRLGRVWTWRSGDQYGHCGLNSPRCCLEDGVIFLPTQPCLDNPNYAHFCDICLDGRTRNVPACKPEWGPCSHAMHQPTAEPVQQLGEAA
ncbi:hypothetical protein [Streptomyces sp. SGAir0957]